MKLTVYPPWCGPRPKPGLLAVVVQLISSAGTAIFLKLAQWMPRPRNLDPNFTGHRFTWRNRGIRERRMPESSRALLIRSTNLDCCPLPAKTSWLWVPNHFCNTVDHKGENLKFCSRKAWVHVGTVQFSAQIFIAVKLKGKSQKLSCALPLSWQ